MDKNERFDVLPTRISLQIMKTRLKVSEKGHKLLKKKSDALQVKFREVGQEIIEIKYMIGKVMKESAHLLAETKYLTGDISSDILNRVSKARLKVRHRFENIAGVQLVIYESYEAGSDQYGLTGLAKGGERLQQLKKAYSIAVDILMQMATLQNAFQTLEEVIRKTNRRVNGLEYRYIPKIKTTVKHIENELDESEREDFYRMKMIKNKKAKEIKTQKLAAEERKAELKNEQEENDK